MKSTHAALNLAATLALLAAVAHGGETPRSHRDEEQALQVPGDRVEVSATATRTEFRQGQISGPSLTVAMRVQNPTDRELELGESIVVLEKSKESDDYVASYIARARAEAVPHLARFEDRYGGWGYEISREGSYSYALIARGGFSFGTGSAAPYEGLGFGRVSPHALRTLTVELMLPYQIEPAKRAYRAVVLPSVRTLGDGAGPMTRTVLRLERDAPRAGVLRALETTTIAMLPADLRALATAAQNDLWQRLFALNWLAEAAPGEAGGLLIETAASETAPKRLRRAALVNLGLIRETSAAAPLVEVARATADDEVRRWALETLGAIGDRSSAPAIRSFFGHADAAVATAAIAAAGSLGDAEAVEPLLALVASLSVPPAHAKQKGGQDLTALLASLSGRSDLLAAAGKDARLPAAAAALAAIGTPPAIEALIAQLGSASGDLALQTSAIDALAAKGGETASRAALAALASPHPAVRGRAAAQLGKTKAPTATAALWQAYRGERDEKAAEKLATALIDAGIDDRTAPAFLMLRLDVKRNPLWFDDVRLLRQLTGQTFGPPNKWSDKKEREAELKKWQAWWLTAHSSWPAQ
jgi:HEAT repeat protein